MTCRFPRQAAALAASLAVAACVAPSTPPPVQRPAAARPPSYSIVGLEGVMGRTARALEVEFGRPQLVVEEGTARKLQFASSICVLDVYLYPPARGGEAVVTYVDARLPDGRDVDRASCVAALLRGEESRLP